MKLLAIDCGIKNLAYCLYDITSKSIEIWEVIDIGSNNQTCTYIPQLCIDYLENNKQLLECNKVIIERQPPRNSKMRVLEGSLYSYFTLRGKLEDSSTITEVETFSPLYKLAGMLGLSGKKSYGARKKAAINKVKELLSAENMNGDDTWLRYFCEHKKRDDLADCYLMILAYIENETNAANTEPKRILAKKPPDDKKIKDYTLGQLKYVLREHMKTNENVATFVEKEEQKELKDRILKDFENIEACLSKFNLNL